MRKQLLFAIPISLLIFAGCSQSAEQEQNQVQSNSSVNTTQTQQTVANEDNKAGSNEDLAKIQAKNEETDKKVQAELDNFYNGLNGPVTKEDCQKLTDKALQEGCLQAVEL